MIAHSIPGWYMDDASHRVNFDTSSLEGLAFATFP